MSKTGTEGNDEWGQPTETRSIKLDGSVPVFDIDSFATSNTIKIGKVSARWIETDKCCDEHRINYEWKIAVERWIQDQLKIYKNYNLISHGWGMVVGECELWENHPKGFRCRGTLCGSVWVCFQRDESS
ncbi:hypothetical protein [Sphingobium yanoikuyae]|uniref:hypothetical protein n=1 Tax=Sphingobium TaxID=165695 RepID=UPI0028DB4C5B|nr:hypothetical protein [Sphingobium yanoikuyae]